MPDHSNIIISWCPNGVGIRQAEGHVDFSPLQIDEETSLPHISEQQDTCDAAYLPMEDMLVRHFSFPLKHPKFLDKDILLEELADTAGIEPDDWWLTWQAKPCEDGIAGLVFGIRKQLKDALNSTPPWQQAPLILIDGWQRLNHSLAKHAADDVAVVDADADGVFLGVYKQGIWAGMRRLNTDMHNEDAQKHIAEQTLWSLQAMGFDAESMPIIGRLTPSLAAVFPKESLDAKIETSLAQRHITNLTLPLPALADKEALNIRHGSWAQRNASSALRIWYRPALIAASICVLWLGLVVSDNYRLEADIAEMDKSITDAFHRGLPNQPVMIDAIAQLRQAASGSASTSTSQVSKTLEVMSKVFQETPWQMQEFNLIRGSITLAGKVKSLDTLNTIKDKLSKLGQNDVQITDTDLNDNEVAFRMRW